MSNMAYCRFQNTLEDLRDCYAHWDDVHVSTRKWCYVDYLGRILGEVFKIGLDDYHATLGNRNLGRYIHEDGAKQAVLNASCGQLPREL